MARAGVNYHDVAQAAVELKAKGLRPTVDRIREFLGTGSKSTPRRCLSDGEPTRGIWRYTGPPSRTCRRIEINSHERVQQLADNQGELAKRL